MRLTIISDGRRLVRDFTAADVPKIAKAIRQESATLEQYALTVLVEDDMRITHIICRRGPIATVA